MPYVSHADVADGGNGAATNADDFVRNKLATFLTSATHFPSAADRWSRSKADVNFGTSEYDVFLTPGSNALAKGAPYMAMHTKDAAIYMFAADGFDTTTPAYDQPGGVRGHPGTNGQSTIVGQYALTNYDRHECQWLNNMGTGPYIGHHLFAPSDGSYVYAAIQIATRRWRHMWWGAMEKFGSYTGGAFSCGHYWAQGTSPIDLPYDVGHVYPGCAHSSLTGNRAANLFRADGFRTGVSWWQAQNFFTARVRTYTRAATNVNWSSQNGTTVDIGDGSFSGMAGSLGNQHFCHSPSALSGYQPFIPYLAWVNINFEGADRWAPVGRLPGIARCSMKYFTPGQQVTVGADNWRVFPLVNSDTVNTLINEEYSGYEGYAIKEV